MRQGSKLLYKKAGISVLLALTLGFLSFSGASYALNTARSGTPSFVDERSYSTTVVYEPAECSLSDFDELCSHMERMWSTRFERAIVSSLNARSSDALNLTDRVLNARTEPARQEIRMRIVNLKELGFAIIGADIHQSGNGVEKRFYETENIDLKDNKVLGFDGLFKDPKLASMICARKFEQKYEKYHMPLFSVLSATLQTGPWNFMLRPDGIEIVFTPGTAEPGNKISTLFVSADDLKNAGVNAKYFPMLNPEFRKKMPPRPRPVPEDIPDLQNDTDMSPMGILPPPPPAQ